MKIPSSINKVDRNSVVDAQRYLEKLLPLHGSIEEIATFLAEKITVAHNLNPSNWNLNLSPSENLLQFNVGHVYCIQIRERRFLILCLADSLPTEIKNGSDDFYFLKGAKSEPCSFNESTQRLATIPGSRGVAFKKNVEKWLSLISESNNQFIRYSILKTKKLPRMIESHSIGAIEYLSRVAQRSIPNPSFAIDAISDVKLSELAAEFSSNTKIKSSLLSIAKSPPNEKLLERAAKYNPTPERRDVKSSVFIRNPWIVELALRQASGICQDCHQPAPFINRFTNKPFLEVHHIISLAQGGSDTLDNLIALCPNCHRKRHYG